MSFNGSGTFLINSTGQPVVANTVISATVFNALTADLASGLTNCITKDGQSTPTANIPMGSNKITGLANGTLTSDAATLGQVQTTAAKLIGSISGVDTITGVMSPTLPAYAAGQLFYFVAGGANTGAVTLNIDSLGAKAVTRDGSTALAAGDINSGEMVVVIYDGTRFQMINAANSFGNTTINGTLTVTGKSNLAEVSSPSINASVAVINALTATGASIASANAATAVVTNLTATNASVASVNAGVALVTTATVTSLTATGASIASANIGNLQFTAASIASINAGVAVVTDLTATGASIASANVGTAVITTGTVTSLTATSASVASANAGTAVITNGAVTNLTSTSASIASANAAVALITTGTVTNLTSTAASVASANIGTAVITGLTATGASIASANAGNLQVTGASVASANLGTAVITTGTVTNLTSTSASVASANLGVALVTTGTVTNLTSTAASIASANIGVAAIGSLSFTGASIASLNAGVAVINNLTATSASIASMNGSVASITTVNATTVDATNVEVTNVKAKDGTAAITIADSTGAVTVGAGATVNGGAVFNETGADVDFRIESDTNANAFFLDGATGKIGMGSSSVVNTGLRLSNSIDGSTTAYGIFVNPEVQPTVVSARYNATSVNTASNGGTPYTVSSLAHYGAIQSTFHADSTVTNQYGFEVASNLTDATNNYGFYSNIASGSGRYNFFANGSADNYFAGNVGIGTSSPTRRLDVIHDTLYQFRVGTSAANSYDIGRSAIDGYLHFYGNQSTVNGYVFEGIDGTRMTIDSSGNVGIGGTADARTKVHVLGTLPTSSNASQGFRMTGQIPSGTTSTAQSYISIPSTEAASYTLTQLDHFRATQGPFGAGSTVSNQYGFNAVSTLTGATNNYGFYSGIASGSNRWNFYAGGTADNYFAGRTGIGLTPDSNYGLTVYKSTFSAILKNDVSANETISTWNAATSGDNVFEKFYTEGTATARGSISYNRVGGLVAYNTTSDYRAKDVFGAWDDSGATIDALKVYRGKMHGATLERPMMIAHEAQAVVPYAVGGEKDAVDKDGKPVYQTMDHQILVPLLIAELQAVRARLAALEAK